MSSYELTNVLSLITSGHPTAARDAWRKLSFKLKLSDNKASLGSVETIYASIANTWLSSGRPRDAAVVIWEIKEYLGKNDELLKLAHVIADAWEADVLGYSMYAETVPFQERWVGPRTQKVRELQQQNNLKIWYPGRILTGGTKGVQIIYATPNPRDFGTTFLSTFSEQQLNEWGLNKIHDPNGCAIFVELAVDKKDNKYVAESQGPPWKPRPAGLESCLTRLEEWLSP